MHKHCTCAQGGVPSFRVQRILPYCKTYHDPDNFRFSQPRRDAAMSMQ